ncbi:MAG: response regulator transcription factor [Chitinophagaceae bacterium]|nr:response regulator transcription factor [Chitinophagaceae bacterium]
MKSIKDYEQVLSKSLKKQLNSHVELEIETEGIEKVNHEFFEKLNQICPDLTTGEKDLTGLIRLNFSSKEISSMRNISPSSVRMAKFRLKKKLGLDPDLELVEFIRKV